MKKGIIYLVQPAELIGTNRYKPGFSNSPSLKRFSGYKNGTRYLRVAETTDPKNLETKILDEFRKKFKLIAGNEYFEGNEIGILNLFDREFQKHQNGYNHNSEDIEEELKELEELEELENLNDYENHESYESNDIDDINDSNDNISCDSDDSDCSSSIIENNKNYNEFVCEKCGKNFTTKASLKYHEFQKVCSKVTVNECRYCHKHFAHQSSLSRHERHVCKERFIDDDVDDIDNEEILEKFAEIHADLQAQIDELKKENNQLKIQNTKTINNIYNFDHSDIVNTTNIKEVKSRKRVKKSRKQNMEESS